MIEEPYRWLEAIENRREYIRDQIRGASPVFAVSRPEGILLVGVGIGQSKVFEIYDRHAMAALGHPVDIEKLRQSAIEAAHLEGFNRSPEDVTLRRLVNFALSPALKDAFEAVFSPPLMVESIFAELGDSQDTDLLVRLYFDGRQAFAPDGLLVAHTQPEKEEDAVEWMRRHLPSDADLPTTVRWCLAAWVALIEDRALADTKPEELPELALPGKTVEIALIDRKATGRNKVRFPSLERSSV